MGQQHGKLDSLEGVLSEAWKMLARGAGHYDDPLHWPVLGTAAQEGSSLRTVILRQFIRSERILVCHTDARAGKVRDIRRRPQVSWLFYHPGRKIQLRLSGAATLHADDTLADAQWAAASLTSRLNYCATHPPGTPIDRPSSGLPAFLRDKVPTLLQSEKGRPNFMAIAGRVDIMDWLRLGTLGHRRAIFRWDENKLTASWVVP